MVPPEVTNIDPATMKASIMFNQKCHVSIRKGFEFHRGGKGKSSFLPPITEMIRTGVLTLRETTIRTRKGRYGSIRSGFIRIHTFRTS